jgi:hypothetical protein
VCDCAFQVEEVGFWGLVASAAVALGVNIAIGLGLLPPSAGLLPCYSFTACSREGKRTKAGRNSNDVTRARTRDGREKFHNSEVRRDPITNRIGLNSHLQLPELLIKSSLITSSDVPTHFPPGEQPAGRLNLR